MSRRDTSQNNANNKELDTTLDAFLFPLPGPRQYEADFYAPTSTDHIEDIDDSIYDCFFPPKKIVISKQSCTEINDFQAKYPSITSIEHIPSIVPASIQTSGYSSSTGFNAKYGTNTFDSIYDIKPRRRVIDEPVSPVMISTPPRFKISTHALDLKMVDVSLVQTGSGSETDQDLLPNTSSPQHKYGVLDAKKGSRVIIYKKRRPTTPVLDKQVKGKDRLVHHDYSHVHRTDTHLTQNIEANDFENLALYESKDLIHKDSLRPKKKVKISNKANPHLVQQTIDPETMTVVIASDGENMDQDLKSNERIKKQLKILMDNASKNWDVTPFENRISTPHEMNINLMEHQKVGVEWMVNMERSTSRGGSISFF